MGGGQAHVETARGIRDNGKPAVYEQAQGAGKFVMGKQRHGIAPESSPQTEMFGKLK